MTALMAEKRSTWERDFLLDTIAWGPRALSWPVVLVRKSTESVKADAEREPGYQQRDLERLKDRLERDQKRYSPAVDVRVLESWVLRLGRFFLVSSPGESFRIIAPRVSSKSLRRARKASRVSAW